MNPQADQERKLSSSRSGSGRIEVTETSTISDFPDHDNCLQDQFEQFGFYGYEISRDHFHLNKNRTYIFFL